MINGIFSVIIQKEDTVIVIVDRFRTYPIFYRKKNNCIVLSDEVDALFDTGELKKNNYSIFQEFSGFGYTLNDATLIEGVFQTRAGEIIYIHKTHIVKEFFHIHSAAIENIDYEVAKCQLHTIFCNLIKKTSIFLQGKKVALPLSGGFDSRLLAVFLKEAGVKDVICFTFGTRKKNPEKLRAQKVAQRLGFRWHFVDYDTINKNGFLETQRFKKFYQYEAQYVSKFAFMQYFAACYLQDELNIPKGTYIMPGHGGDFFSGSHLRPYMRSYKKNNTIAADLCYIHSDLVTTTTKIRKREKEKIKNSLNENIPLYNNIENWDLKERQAKYIINSCKLWEYFNWPYYMPLCDNEFMDFFVKLPFEYRVNQKLYIDVISEIFEKYNLNFEEDNKREEVPYKQKIKAYIKRTFPCLRKKTDLFQWDYFDFKTTSKPIVEELKQNSVFSKIRSMNGIFTEWYLLQIKKFN
ncbi:MAG: asparagine synthase C-terminal domain-containing protein [Bacteroidales bacterium]